MKLFVADLQNDVIQEPPISVRAYHAQTVSEFKKMVAEVSWNIDFFCFENPPSPMKKLLGTGLNASSLRKFYGSFTEFS